MGTSTYFYCNFKFAEQLAYKEKSELYVFFVYFFIMKILWISEIDFARIPN